MNIHTTKLALSNDPLPAGCTLVGWIGRHPRDPEEGSQACAVLRTRIGAEVAFSGTSSVRGLPAGWRDLVPFEPAP